VPVGDLLDAPLLTPDNPVEHHLADEPLPQRVDDLGEEAGKRPLLPRLQPHPAPVDDREHPVG
jgi:hypothetical protein